MASWLAGGGWLVGKSDFDENPVISLDLDLDFGLRLGVCPNPKCREGVSIKLHVPNLICPNYPTEGGML